MIPCQKFILAYSELFRYLDEKDGKDAVVQFWEYLAKDFLWNLRELVSKHGIRGCWKYWGHTLNEEAADFTMTIDDEKGFFRVEHHNCPSKRRLLETDLVEPYEDYCEHCDVLYRHVLEPLGYEYERDLSHCDEARCSFTIRGNSNS